MISLSLYVEPITWQGSLSEIYQVSSSIVDVLGRHNFKKVDKCRLIGIDKIITEEKEITSSRDGFLDMDLNEILSQMASRSELTLNHRNRWYVICGNYRRPSEILQNSDTFTATIKVDGNKGSKKANISIEIWYETSHSERDKIPQVENEIAPVFEDIKKIKI